MTLQQKALEIAISQLGVEEHPRGSNRGPQVDQYLIRTGYDPTKGSYAWCASFVYWCFDEAATSMSVKNPLAKTGGVMDQWNKRKAEFRVTGAPQPGDIGILDLGNGLGHMFIVESVELDHVHNVEGNTNDEGGREGYEVCRRTRLRSKVMGYLRFK